MSYNNQWLGQPVGWCTAVKEDTTVIELFLHEIHQGSPNAGVKTIMTDDDIYITSVMHTKIMSVLLDNADGLLLSEYVDVILDTFFIDGILIN